MPTQDMAPVSGEFPVDVDLHPLEIGIQAIQLLAISRGSRNASLHAWTRPLISWHATVPFAFRFQVSHRTQ